MLWSFVRLSRPHFLLGGLLLFALGATSTGAIDITSYLLAQLMVTSSQLTAHYINEFADREVDRAVVNRTLFSGGSGVVSSGLLSSNVALTAGIVTSAVSGFAALFVMVTSVEAAVLGVVTLGVSWAYSMPPIRLLNTGFGEVVTSVTVAGLVPLIGATAMDGGVPMSLWWGIGVLVPVHMAMMLAFEIPDLDSDAAAGRVIGLIGRVGGVAVAALPAVVLLTAARRSNHRVTTLAAVVTFVTAVIGLLLVNVT